MHKVFFATDVHGSDLCWRKLVSAGQFYKADVVVLGGDTTGKQVVPLVKQTDGKVTSDFLGIRTVLDKEEEVKTHEKYIIDAGYYAYHTTPEEMSELSKNPQRAQEVFKKLMIERTKAWVRIADENLKGSGMRFIVSPGNDDDPIVDTILEQSEVIENAEGKVLQIAGHEMINCGWTNPTPWQTLRECSEEALKKKIDDMISEVKDPKRSIFQLHAPPYGSGLDEAPSLNKDLKVGGASGPVGSKAVAEAIQQCHPLVGLHGHIHESRGVRKIGRTLCFNPGSMYSEGILQGVLMELERDRVKNYVLTSG